MVTQYNNRIATTQPAQAGCVRGGDMMDEPTLTIIEAAKELSAAASIVYMAYELPGNENWKPGALEALYDANARFTEVMYPGQVGENSKEPQR